jgi:hypothetical protein
MSESTWEPLQNLDNATDIIKEFHQQYPTAPHPPHINRIEIPMSQFPQGLLRPLPILVTEQIDTSLPTESLAYRLASGSDSKRGVMS